MIIRLSLGHRNSQGKRKVSDKPVFAVLLEHGMGFILIVFIALQEVKYEITLSDDAPWTFSRFSHTINVITAVFTGDEMIKIKFQARLRVVKNVFTAETIINFHGCKLELFLHKRQKLISNTSDERETGRRARW